LGSDQAETAERIDKRRSRFDRRQLTIDANAATGRSGRLKVSQFNSVGGAYQLANSAADTLLGVQTPGWTRDVSTSRAIIAAIAISVG